MSQSNWVWSDLFAWNNAPLANDRCKNWHLKEPSPDKFKGICIMLEVNHALLNSECLNLLAGLPFGGEVIVISCFGSQKFACGVSSKTHGSVLVMVSHVWINNGLF